ncbi:MAG: hypothetical protein AB1758_24220, partial [Candidatus Eremiobacterota bacterium]
AELDFDQSLVRALLTGASPRARPWLLRKAAAAGRNDLVAALSSGGQVPLHWMRDEEFRQRLEIPGAAGVLLRRLGELRPDQAASLLRRLQADGFESDDPLEVDTWERLRGLQVPPPDELREALRRLSVVARWPEEPGQAVAVSEGGTSLACADPEHIHVCNQAGQLRSLARPGIRQLAVSDDGELVWACDGQTAAAWQGEQLLWEQPAARFLSGPGGLVALLVPGQRAQAPRIWFSQDGEPPFPAAWLTRDPRDWVFFAGGTQLAVPQESGEQLMAVRVIRGDQSWLMPAHTEPILRLASAPGRVVTASHRQVILWSHPAVNPFLLEAIRTASTRALCLAVNEEPLAVGHADGVDVYADSREWNLSLPRPRALQFCRSGLLVAHEGGRVLLWSYRNGGRLESSPLGFVPERWQGPWAIGAGQAARVSLTPIADQPLRSLPRASLENVAESGWGTFLATLLEWEHRYSVQLSDDDPYGTELDIFLE